MPSEKSTAVLAHVLGIFTLFLGPLVMYFVFKKNASPWLRNHIDESVNHHIMVPVAAVLLMVLAVVLTAWWPGVALTLMVLAVLIFVASVVFGIIATVKAARGKTYHYPLDIKMVR